MAKYYKNAATRLNVKLHKKFEDYCKLHGCTIHTNLKNYVESLVIDSPEREVSESNNEQRGSIEGNIEPIRLETGSPEASPPDSNKQWRLWG